MPSERKTIRQLKDEYIRINTEILHKPIVNEESGDIAELHKAGFKKMISDKAIQKSIDNGFTKAEHIVAAIHIEMLFRKGKKAATLLDEKMQMDM